MARLIATSVVVGILSMGIVGCGETEKTESKTVSSGPGGKTETDVKETKTTQGDGGPASGGKAAEPKPNP